MLYFLAFITGMLVGVGAMCFLACNEPDDVREAVLRKRSEVK